MRVNHVGEVCAQALYSAQALATRDEHLRQHLQAAEKKQDHLAWTHSDCKRWAPARACSTPLVFRAFALAGLWLPR